MRTTQAALCASALALLAAAPTQAQPLLIEWTGTLDVVLASGGGVFANSAEGDQISGSFIYSDTEAESTVIPVSATETDYEFSGPPFAGTIENLDTGENSFQEPVLLIVANDDPLDANDALLINEFLPTSFVEDDPVDAWSLEVDPGDPDPEWFIAFVDAFAPLDLYSDTSFRADPPPPAMGSVDLAVFQLEQVDPDNPGEFLFLGAGILGGFEVTPVPVPAVALLFPSGLLAGFAWMRRRRLT